MTNGAADPGPDHGNQKVPDWPRRRNTPGDKPQTPEPAQLDGTAPRSEPDMLADLDGLFPRRETPEEAAAYEQEFRQWWEAEYPGKSFEPSGPRLIALGLSDIVRQASLTQEERDSQAAGSRRRRYEQLCGAELVPRFAIYDNDEFWDRQRKVVLTAAKLETSADALRLFGFKGSKSDVSPSTLLRRDPRVIHIYGQISRPGCDDEFVTVPNEHGVPVLMANIYRPGPPPAVPAAGSPVEFLAHVEWLVPDPHESKGLLDWMAFKHQRPGVYSPLCPFLLGPPGNGKDTLLGLFARVVGEHNVAHPPMSTFSGQFEDFLIKQYVLCSEYTFGGPQGPEMYDRLKARTGAPDLPYQLNMKAKAFMFTRIQPTFIFTSNAENALKHVPNDDRRLAVFGCSARPAAIGMGSPEYFADLRALFEHPTYVARVSRYLLDRDVSGYNPGQAFISASRAKGLVGGLSTAAREAFDIVTAGALAGRRLFSYGELLSHLPHDRYNEYHNQAVLAGLRAAGCVKAGDVRRGVDRTPVYTGASMSAYGASVSGLSGAETDQLIALAPAALLAALEGDEGAGGIADAP